MSCLRQNHVRALFSKTANQIFDAASYARGPIYQTVRSYLTLVEKDRRSIPCLASENDGTRKSFAASSVARWKLLQYNK